MFTHESEAYRRIIEKSAEPYNGAYYYSAEIVRNIIPNVRTDRDWVTVDVTGNCSDGSIVFIHNNVQPRIYDWLADYRDLVLVCGIPETCRKVAHLGRAVYLPLSIDVAEVASHKRPKDRDTAFFGRPSKAREHVFNPWTDVVSGLERDAFLDEMARYRNVYAVGRTAIEAKALDCDILFYDQRFRDLGFWRVVDNKEAAAMLQAKLDEVDG